MDFFDTSLYEAVMSCDGDCVSGGGELIVRIPRDVYKDYPSFVIGSESRMGSKNIKVVLGHFVQCFSTAHVRRCFSEL